LAFHLGHEADHSPLSSAEVKEWVELYLHSPNTPSWRGAQGEHRDNFTFTFIINHTDSPMNGMHDHCQDFHFKEVHCWVFHLLP
jgi:hypothetical protein